MFLACIFQAWHSHGAETDIHSKLGHGASISAAQLSADACPLCEAMQSARPAEAWRMFVTELIEPPVFAPTLNDKIITQPPGHSHHSRPPPGVV